MIKLAIFVEGLTEQILVRKMLESVLAQEAIAIQTVKITGGHHVRMSFTVMRAARVDSNTDYYVLIYDCGGETNVKSYLLARRSKLLRNGYKAVLGLRDVYPNFSVGEADKLRNGLNRGLPQKGARTYIHLAVMETEAWFLGEYNHLKKVSKKLTPNYIEKKLGFNPATADLESRERPAEDMKTIYRLVDHDYTKKRDRLNAVISKLDFQYFTGDLARRLPSLGAFIDELERFFRTDFNQNAS